MPPDGLSVPMATATRAHASVRLYTDGASRGNPGPSASAWIIVDAASGEVLAERSVFIGRGTNNEAEYTAIIGGLRDCLALGAREVELCTPPLDGCPADVIYFLRRKYITCLRPVMAGLRTCRRY